MTGCKRAGRLTSMSSAFGLSDDSPGSSSRSRPLGWPAPADPSVLTTSWGCVPPPPAAVALPDSLRDLLALREVQAFPERV